MMSSGWAACPLDDFTYCGLSLLDPLATTEAGSDVGTVRKVYGSVTAVGICTKGDIVKGTCANKG